MHDISKQKSAERKLRESENKIRVILDHSAAAITLIDKNERIQGFDLKTKGEVAEDIFNEIIKSINA